jgi:GNAT superfamily N-acetyltransferase
MSAVPSLPAYGFDIVQLADGARVKVRPIWLGDISALRRMHGRMSEQTIYYRFMTACPRPSQQTLRFLAGVDHAARDALVAVEQGEIVGVARYHSVEDGVAEIAVVVEDAWQKRGIGRELVTRIASLARERGVRTFTGTMIAENRAASSLLVSVFPQARRRIEHGELLFEIPLDDPVSERRNRRDHLRVEPAV